MSIRVRPTRLSDAPLLPTIERSAGDLFRTVPELAWIADGDIQSVEEHRAYAMAGCAWVAVDDAGAPFGFLNAERFGLDLHIWELAVRADRQGQGAGRALVAAAVAFAKEQRCTGVTLTTFKAVAWNAPLYARLGFDTIADLACEPRLRAVLLHEADLGLPTDRRCAMRQGLDAAAPSP
jgi:GNAT superfamily N-acetyltransferase